MYTIIWKVILSKYYIDEIKWLERLPSCHTFKMTDLKSYLNSIKNVKNRNWKKKNNHNNNNN